MLARAGLSIVIFALLIDVAAVSTDLIRLGRLRGGGTEETIGLDFSSTLSAAANLAVPLSVLIAAATFGWWFWSSYRQLSEAGSARWPAVAAIVGWVIPLVNVVAPPTIMRELLVSPGRASWLDTRNVMVGGWWVLWIEGAIIQAILRFITPETNAGWTNWFTAALLANLMLITSLACALALVAMVDGRKDDRPSVSPTRAEPTPL